MILTKEFWYFLIGALSVLLPLLVVVAVKKLQWLEPRPDETLVYTRAGDTDLRLHAFYPDSADTGGQVPALLLFHGGRWQYGGPHSLYPQCRYFAARGIACFSAEYRLGAQSRVDVRGAVEDARRALHYLRDNARELGIDPDRLYAGGGSSGGHLAAALGAALPPGDAPAMRPAALVLYNPMLDLSPGKPDSHLVVDYWRAVSPLQQIDEGYPPTLILAGTEDPEVPVATVRAFCDAVRRQGGRCEAQLYEGQSHGFYHDSEGRNPYLQQTGAHVLAFLTSLEG
ncbi:MAG: alpha/beta hydrolase [Halioglobus sp.]|nr:alpha/beta hydrolase [Halioglobus sp.]